MALSDFAKRNICVAMGSEKLGLTLAAKIDSAAAVVANEKDRLGRATGSRTVGTSLATKVAADTALAALELHPLRYALGVTGMAAVNSELG